MKNIPVLLIVAFIWIMTPLKEANALFFPYPQVLSQPIDILPPGAITITVGDETYYYGKGIFYQKVILDQKYVVVPPPIGGIVFTIPPGYQMILINGITYYEFAGVYYKRVLEGYRVIYPPV